MGCYWSTHDPLVTLCPKFCVSVLKCWVSISYYNHFRTPTQFLAQYRHILLDCQGLNTECCLYPLPAFKPTLGIICYDLFIPRLKYKLILRASCSLIYISKCNIDGSLYYVIPEISKHSWCFWGWEALLTSWKLTLKESLDAWHKEIYSAICSLQSPRVRMNLFS